MATGIEAAGLALAIFPLVIEGLKSYSSGVKTIKDIWRYQVVLNSLIRELAMEKCKFENTLASLLEGIVSESDLTRLMSVPDFWGSEDLQNTLKTRLREDTVKVYVDAIKDLVSELEVLKKNFGLGIECKSENKTTLRKKWKMIRLVVSKAEYKEQLNKISKINSDLATLSGQTNFASTITQTTASAKNYKLIRNHAMSLYGVLKEKLQPAAPFCPCSTPHNANLQLEMRNTDFGQKGFGQKGFGQKGFGQDISLRFHVVISFESAAADAEIPVIRTWRDLELEPIDGGKEEELEEEQTEETGSSSENEDAVFHAHVIPPTPPVVIAEGKGRHGKGLSMSNIKSRVKGIFRDRGKLSKTASLPELHKSMPTMDSPPAPPKPSLQALRRASRTSKPRKVSFSTPPAPRAPAASRKPTKRIEHLCLIMQQVEPGQACLGVLADKSGQYLVWPVISSPSPETTELISLSSLLTQGKISSKKDRLILGVQLASTVLQLHKTGWLRESWSSEDIFFNHMATEGRTPNFKKPLVRQSPDLSSSQMQTIQDTIKSALIPHDQSLFCLGIVLVELWYGGLLESLWVAQDGVGSGDNTKFMTAMRLTHQISSDAGVKYGDSVRRCIRGLDHRYESLEIDDFKNEVHMKVVVPLLENLETFCGEEISQIFPGRRKMSAASI